MVKRLRIVLALLVILAMLLPILPTGIASAAGENWLSDYSNRQPVVFGSAAGSGTNYSVLLYVGEDDAAGGNISLNGNAVDYEWANGIGDLRFTEDDGETELDYWVEAVTGSGDNELAKVWIEVTDDLTAGDATIYVYYGKSGQTTTSSISDTFTFGDDFNRADNPTVGGSWTETNSSIDGNTMKVSRTGGADETPYHALTFSGNVMVETVTKKSTLTIGSELYTYSNAINKLGCIGYNFSGAAFFVYLNNTGFHYTSVGYVVDTWYRQKILWDSSDSLYDYWVDNTLLAQNQTPANTATTNRVLFQVYNSNHDLFVDFLFARKYTSPEPLFASAGAEEGTTTVVTVDASDITATTAILNGEVTYTEEAVLERGFDWDTVSGTPYADDWTELGSWWSGTFAHFENTFSDGITYYFRAKIRTASGWFYGDEEEFTCGAISYINKRKLTIAQTVGAGTDYQVKVDVAYGQGAESWSMEATNPVLTGTLPMEVNNVYAFTGMIEDGTYKCWYGAFHNTGSPPVSDAIYYATSTDGKTWTKYPTNPVFTKAASGWDRFQVNDPSVVKVGNTYYMYYSGTAENGHDYIGLATSLDGINWTRYSGNPVIGAGSGIEAHPARPTVIVEDSGLFRMWYDVRTNANPYGVIIGVYYATSLDGYNWTKYGQVIEGFIGNPEVKRFNDNTLLMVADSPYEYTTPVYLDTYTSTNGINWTKTGDKIIGAGAWHPYGALAAGLLQVGNEWRMYFGGVTDPSFAVNKIGLAYLGDSLSFNGTCRTDFGDVRFVEDDEVTTLDYWLETYTLGSKATFWVEVSGDLDAGDVDIYMCWGESESTTTSNGDNTFLFFDDFLTLDAVTWDDNSGTPSVSGGVLSLGADPDRIRNSTDEFGNNTAIRARAKSSAITNKARLGVSDAVITSEMYSDEYVYISFEPNGFLKGCFGEGGVENGEFSLQAYLADTYYVIESQREGDYKLWAVNDVVKEDYSCTSPPAQDLNLRLEGVTGTTSVDWVLVRKFIYTEPTITVGALEQYNPTLLTTSATTITTTTASLNGNVTDMGEPVTLYVRFQYGISTSFGLFTPEQTIIATGAVQGNVTGLLPATTYFYRIIARYDTDSFTYGNIISFSTLATGAPAVTTGISGSITGTSATVYGALSSIGGYSPVYVYFQYGLTTSYGTNTPEQLKIAIGDYSQAITGLSENSTYHYRAVVRYSTSSYSYGSDMSFTTSMVTLGAPTDLSEVRTTGQIALSWSKGTNAVNTLVRRSTTSFPSAISEGVQVYFGTGSGHNDTGLTDTQGYYYSAWSEKDGAYSSTYATLFSATYTGTGTLNPPDTFQIYSVSVFKSYQESNDQIIVIHYEITFNAGNPIKDARDYVSFELYNGVTLVAKAPVKAWGERPGSIYLSPSYALTWGQVFTVKMVGKPSQWVEAPTVTYSANIYNWDTTPTTLTDLDEWCWNTASMIDSAWVVSLAEGLSLTTDACTAFNLGISGLSGVRPLVCRSSMDIIVIPTPDPATIYVPTAGGVAVIGAYFAAFITDLGSVTGTSATWTGYLLSIAVGLIFAAALGFATGSFAWSLIAVIPIIIFLAYAALIGIVVVALLTFILAFLALRRAFA